MSELEELIKQIEELRLSMIKAKEGRSYTDPYQTKPLVDSTPTHDLCLVL